MARRAINDLEEKSSIQQKSSIFRKILEKTPENDELAQNSESEGTEMSCFAFKREISVLADMILSRFAFKREIWKNRQKIGRFSGYGLSPFCF